MVTILFLQMLYNSNYQITHSHVFLRKILEDFYLLSCRNVLKNNIVYIDVGIIIALHFI